MKHVINLNDEIRVQLTEHGKKLEEKYLSSLGDLDVKIKSFSEYRDFQLWEFMNVFGKHLWNGADQVIVNNEIEVL